MKKRFNVTGACFSEQHYVADTSAKFARIMEMIEMGNYFAINRPRQYGKTTTLFQLLDTLNKTSEYIALSISFEGVGDIFQEEATFCPIFLDLLKIETEYWGHTDLTAFLVEAQTNTTSFKLLSEAITTLVRIAKRKIVLLIDEIDKSSNNQLFVHFLGVLRDKYLIRNRFETFHAVILAGIHDVKSLKLKLRPDEEKKYNSPWNIATDFEVDMNLQPAEIVPMLEEYAQDRGVEVDPLAVAERLFYYTSGYPFLVSKLCKIFDEKLLVQKTEKIWTTHDVDVAARQLVREDNPNFQELTKNLENNRDLYELTKALVVNDRSYPFNLREPLTNLGATYGIFADQNGLAIHNRIYREVIDDYMTVSLLVKNHDALQTEFASGYLLPGNRLDLKKTLLKFQEAMKDEHHKDNGKFLEREGRIVFLAFLKPILNGHGYSFKEPQISEEKRLDVLITYHEHRYVAELKLWRGQQAHEAGLDQLADYLDRLGLDEGYLLIFDPRVKKDWKSEEMIHQGKRIFSVWV